MPDGGAYNVAGVGDGDPDAIEAGVDNAVCKRACRVGGAEQLAIAVACGLSHVTCGVNDDVAAGKFLVAVAHVNNLGVIRHKRKRVVQVLGLRGNLLCVDIAQVKLVYQALNEQGVGNMCAYVALSQYANLTCCSHSNEPF